MKVYAISVFTGDYCPHHVGTETFLTKDEVKSYISEKTGVKFSKDKSIEMMIDETSYEIVVVETTVKVDYDGEGRIVRTRRYGGLTF